MEVAELEVFRTTEGIDMSLLTIKDTHIQMNNQDIAVRTYIYNDDKTKKTLVLTHGYSLSCVYYSRILPALAKHYRIVMFDNLAHGLNTRMTDVGDALDSPEKADAWMVEWWKKVIDALDLPAKFYLSAHSAGGYQA